jgi:phosphoserine/homoserine phosphotransferase
MIIVCLDLEGVLTPEIWMTIASATGIEGLSKTTRDEPDYDKLMNNRIQLLKQYKISLKEISSIIKKMKPFMGGYQFLKWLRERSQVIVLTDSYIQFTKFLLKKLRYPTLFCHELIVDQDGMISDYKLRLNEMKKITIEKLKEMKFKVIAVGDSYNDIGMLKTADIGILFRPPENVTQAYPEIINANTYEELKKLLIPFF